MKKMFLTLAVAFIAITAGAKAPKYVFYFIGDGMGTNEVAAAQMYLADIEGEIGYKPLVFAQFPYTGLAFSYAANTFITDSAAAGTALASGKKTNSNMLGMLPDRESAAESIAEIVKYSLSSSKYSIKRVDLPIQIGKTPVANGSKVPVCPIFFICKIRRKRFTTSCDVIPLGLFIFKKYWNE